MPEDLDDYYRKRAGEYEAIYNRPDAVRQEEQRRIAAAMKKHLAGKEILEIACGTGYWTRFLSEVAKSIVAADYVEEVIEIAKQKSYSCPVRFAKEDAYNLSFGPASFDGGMANFWLSHVPKVKIDSFLAGFHGALKPGSPVFMADNVHVEGVGGNLIKKEGDENTYKLRKLRDDTEHLVMKNYFTAAELAEIFSKHASGFADFGSSNVFFGKCFWYVAYSI